MSKQVQALTALGQSRFMSSSRQELGMVAGALNSDGTVNAGRVSNLLKQIAINPGWKHPSLLDNGKTNTAIENRISQSLSVNFVSGWKLHRSILPDMPELFSAEVPEKIISDKARDWLQAALLADVPNQFVLSCAMAERSIESDFRLMQVESKAMRESRLAAEKAQLERDLETIAALERKGYIVVCPDVSTPTGMNAILHRGNLLINDIVSKEKELAQLKLDRAKLAKSLDKLSGDDLAAARTKLSSIESESAGLAERIRKACDHAASLAGVDYVASLNAIKSRIEAWIANQQSSIEEIAKIGNQAKSYGEKVKLPEKQYTAEQEKVIAGLVSVLECSREEAISTLRAKGKL